MKSLFYFINKIHSFSGKDLYINLLAMTCIGLIDGIGIVLLIPLINISGMADFEIGAIPFSGAFEFIKDIPDSIVLPSILCTYILIVIGHNVVQKKITVKNTIIHQGFLRQIRIEMYSRVLQSNWNFFIKKRKSDLINILTLEVAQASAGTNSFLQFLSSLIFTFIQIILAFLLSPSITIFVLLCGVILVFFNRKFLKQSLALGNRNYELGKNYLAGITDQINGIKDIKSNSLELSRIHWYENITKDMEHEQVEYIKLKTTSQLYYKISSAIFIAIFIYFAINLFNAQAGQLMLVIIIFSRLWPKVSSIQSSMEQIATILPSFHFVNELERECKAANELELEAIQYTKSLKINKEIECKNVSFRYNLTEPRFALLDVDIRLPVNKMTAIVGRSGAGKSTLIDILMGLMVPERGQVLIDGTPLTNDNLLSLRKAISYVPQDPFLFNTTIIENLLLIDPEASEERIWEALEFSSAAEFVKRLPSGLDTLIGDRGVRLSGGERQRLVLARAILKKPSILVLDEATSALDSENETKIQKALERIKEEMTVIVIAHRLSTIRNSDQVIVLDQGKIIQQGGFNDLSKDKRGLFRSLLNNQVDTVKEALK